MKSRILYIDDEKENLESFRITFWKYYDIDLSTSTLDGEKLLYQNNYELVISDQKMTGETGLQFIKRVKDDFPQTLFILLTAYSNMEVVIEAINIGVDRYFQKPWDFNELKHAIDNALEKHQLKKKNKELLDALKESNKQLMQNNKELIRKTEQLKEKQTKLAKAVIKSKESDRLKSSILANISHEIRTPLNGILGFSDMILNPSIDEDKKELFNDVIKESSARLLQVITDLLEISNIETDKIEINEEVVCINTIISEMYLKYLAQTRKKGLEFYSNKPFTDIESTIVSDKLRLRQVLDNLLANAIKFTLEGKIEFGYQIKGSWVEMYVKDTGIGIEKDMYEKIFDGFYQVEMKNNRSFAGIGIGLSISKKLIGLLGGEIWLESVPGKGTIFYFTIPYVKFGAANNQTEKNLDKQEKGHYEAQ